MMYAAFRSEAVKPGAGSASVEVVRGDVVVVCSLLPLLWSPLGGRCALMQTRAAMPMCIGVDAASAAASVCSGARAPGVLLGQNEQKVSMLGFREVW